MKVLVVDDSRAAREMMGSALRKEGWDVSFAENGERAWDILCGQPIHVVISDWQMPDSDGLALCRRVRGAHSTLYTYFILLSGVNLSVENGREALRAGVDSFLTKPFDIAQLCLCVLAAQRVLAYANRLRELESIIPICSYCRRLRDDRDAYVKMESYFEKHAGVLFSHGMCPACLAEHYPAGNDAMAGG